MWRSRHPERDSASRFVLASYVSERFAHRRRGLPHVLALGRKSSRARNLDSGGAASVSFYRRYPTGACCSPPPYGESDAGRRMTPICRSCSCSPGVQFHLFACLACHLIVIRIALAPGNATMLHLALTSSILGSSPRQPPFRCPSPDRPGRFCRRDRSRCHPLDRFMFKRAPAHLALRRGTWAGYSATAMLFCSSLPPAFSWDCPSPGRTSPGPTAS
jgi:hypothetical protein